MKGRKDPTTMIVLLEAAGFLLVALAIWFDELFDLAHYLFGAPLSNFNISEAAFESLAVLLLGVAVIVITRRLSRRIVRLEQLLPICSYCKKIRRPDADPEKQESWRPIEKYIWEKTGSQFSHGLCPDCLEKHYGELLHSKP
jgi:hypothetical protein